MASTEISDAARVAALQALLEQVVDKGQKVVFDGIEIMKVVYVNSPACANRPEWQVRIVATDQQHVYKTTDLGGCLIKVRRQVAELRQKLGDGDQGGRLKKLEDFAKEFQRVANEQVQLFPAWLHNLSDQAAEALK